MRAIYLLHEKNQKVTTSAVAESLQVAPASVTKMLKRLATMELVKHEPYKGVSLTPKGEKVSLEIVRHHRLIELFLTEIVGVPWDRVHEEAHRLEHALSEYLEDRLAVLLNDPQVDPHGQPIPSKEGKIIVRDLEKLSEVPVGYEGVVAQVEDADPELLRYVAERGLFPKTRIILADRDPYSGGMTVMVEGKPRTIGLEAAKQIWISALPDNKKDQEA